MSTTRVPTAFRSAQVDPAAVQFEARIEGVRFNQRAPRVCDLVARLRARGDASDDTARSDLRALLPWLLNHELETRSYDGVALPHPLYPFQREGIRFLLDTEPGALLADDMGLGKTVQAIVALRVLLARGRLERALIVAPKSVAISWQRHLAEWSPELRPILLVGTPGERREHWQRLAATPQAVGVVTYDTLAMDTTQHRVAVPEIDVLIADEVQRIKNRNTQRHEAIRGLRSERRWGLSGTPLENKLDDFRTILGFLDPDALPDISVRATRSQRTRNAHHRTQVELREGDGELKALAKRMVRRNRKADVLHELPELVSHVEYVELTDEQRRAYARAEHDGVSSLRSHRRDFVRVRNLIEELKQVCNGVDASSAKCDWLEDYLAVAADAGDKVLVYSQYTNVLPERLKALIPLRYAGDMSDREREATLQQFSDDPREVALLMSVRAGALGLNLQVANRVVHFDSWWNPAIGMQATARAHRIGQAKTVFETTLVSTETVEERIQLLLDAKRELFAEVVDSLSINEVARGFSRDELYDLFDLPAAKAA